MDILAVISCVSGALFAQPRPAFDAASVKLNKSGDVRTQGELAGGRFSMTNETLWRLIGEAYATSQALPRLRIIGGPDWVDTNRFDVRGVTESPLTRERARLMLRALLAERFKLVAHTETRTMPVYALVFARADRRLGPQLRRSTSECGPAPAEGSPQQPHANGLPAPCEMGFGFGRLTAHGMTVTQLATMGLSLYAGRTVVDRTGLTGVFDWTLVWTPDNLPKPAPGTPTDQPVIVNGAAVDPNGPQLFTAVREQLGLELESAKGPVDVIVIDHVEPPTED